MGTMDGEEESVGDDEGTRYIWLGGNAGTEM
jgi:hypothetical protein